MLKSKTHKNKKRKQKQKGSSRSNSTKKMHHNRKMSKMLKMSTNIREDDGKKDERWTWSPSYQLEATLNRVLEKQIHDNMDKVKDMIHDLIEEEIMGLCSAVKIKNKRRKRKTTSNGLNPIPESTPSIKEFSDGNTGIEI